MSQTVNKSSFDRIDDDLCQLILSYLPLKDKLVVECVSKRIKRCVFVRQTDLTIDLDAEDVNNANILVKDHEFLSVQSFRLKLMRREPFVSLLKKCPNVRTIDLRNVEFVNREEIIQMITTYAKSLTHFRMDYIYLMRDIFHPFLSEYFDIQEIYQRFVGHFRY